MLPLITLKCNGNSGTSGEETGTPASDQSTYTCTEGVTFENLRLLYPETLPTMVKRCASGTDRPIDFYSISKIGAPTGCLIRGAGSEDQKSLGISDDALKVVDGVELLVVSGFCPAVTEKQSKESFTGRVDVLKNIVSKKDEDKHDAWVTMIEKHFNVTRLLAEQIVKEAENKQTTDFILGSKSHNHTTAIPWTLDGVECKFRIVSLGAWTRRDAEGNIITTKLQTWANTCAAVTGGQLFQALKEVQSEFEGTGPGQWCLSSNKWIRAGSSGPAPDDGRMPDVDVCAIFDIPGDNKTAYNLSAGAAAPWRVVLPDSNSCGPSRVDDVEVFIPFLTKTIEDLSGIEDKGHATRESTMAVDFFSKLSAGPLKSAFQKLVRFGSERVQLPGGSVDSGIACMAALGICFTNRGDEFLPDLSLFVRGATAALKRLGVVMAEDAWPEFDDPSSMLAATMAAALATVRLPQWIPPQSIITSCLKIINACCKSRCVLRWRTQQVSTNIEQMSVPMNLHHCIISADMLRILRSFHGDMDMLDKIAGVHRRMEGGKNLVTPISTVNKYNGKRNTIVQWEHIIDQHVYRGVGFVNWTMKADEHQSHALPFKYRHDQIFNSVTGFNPRLTGNVIDEESEKVKQVRFAQEIVGKTIVHTDLQDVSALSSTEIKVEIDLEYGVMSGGAEAILATVKTTPAQDQSDDVGLTSGTTWKLMVLLGISTADEMVINAPMGRGSLEDPRPPPSNTAARLAIQQARSNTNGYKFTSPMLRGYNRIKYINGRWTLKSPNSDQEDMVWKYSEEGHGPNKSFVHIRHISNPDWWTNATDKGSYVKFQLMNDELMRTAFSISDTSRSVVCTDWEEMLYTISSVLDDRTRRRLLAAIRGTYKTLKMATPNIQGGSASDGPAPAYGDWHVYRILLLISLIMPAVLRPKLPPTFEVNNAVLLRKVESIISSTTSAMTDVDKLKTYWSPVLEHATSTFMERIDDYPYQRPLIELMRKRDQNAIVPAPAHFLRLRVAAGKTVLAIWYCLEWLAATGGAERVLWLTTKAAIDDHYNQFVKFGFRGVFKWEGSAPIRNDFLEAPKIVLISHESFSANSRCKNNQLDTLVSWCNRYASSSIIVVDEVHRLFATGTNKGASIRRIVEMAPRSVYATAIPPVKSKSALLAPYWLKDCLSFPAEVEQVACASLVVAAIPSPYDTQTTYVGVDLDKNQRAQMIKTLQNLEKTKGQSQYHDGSPWMQLYKEALDFLRPHIVSEAVKLAIADRTFSSTKDGKKPFEWGGCCVVASSTEAARLGDLMREEIRKQNAGFEVDVRQNAKFDANKKYGISIITPLQAEGFNLFRYGYWISAPHPTSAATRLQLKGRIDRLAKQIHKREHGIALQYKWIYPKDTILQNLLGNHAGTDTKIAALDALALRYACNFNK